MAADRFTAVYGIERSGSGPGGTATTTLWRPGRGCPGRGRAVNAGAGKSPGVVPQVDTGAWLDAHRRRWDAQRRVSHVLVTLATGSGSVQPAGHLDFVVVPVVSCAPKCPREDDL